MIITTILVSVNDTLNYYSDIKQPAFKHTLAKSNALRAKHILIKNKIPADKIISISTTKYTGSKTAETAKNTMHFIDSVFNEKSIKANIFSSKPHTRRTFIAYKKYLKKDQQVGIIASSCPVSNIDNARLRDLRELLGIIYLKISPR
jgi:hypothetical protein